MERVFADGRREERRDGDVQFPYDTGDAALEVVQPGSFTTVQDLGRPGYARFGVPDGGAMDKYALQAANMLLGNEPGAAGLEVTNAGLALRVLKPTAVAVAGADLGLLVHGAPAPMWTVLSVEAGDIIHFSSRRLGVRAYLAVVGGVDVPTVMGSRSTYVRAGIGGLDGRALRKGDRLCVGTETGSSGAAVARERVGLSLPEPLRRFGLPLPVRVVAGPQAEAFAPIAFHRLAGSPYVVTAQADRMGYRLQGISLPYAAGPRSTTAGTLASRGPLGVRGPLAAGRRLAAGRPWSLRRPPSAGRPSAADRALAAGRPTDESPDHVSDGVAPGSIQVPGDGQPIVLLADRQTVGGYPKIATVISVDLDFLAHVWPGEPIRFRFVDVETAQRLREIRREILEEVRRFTDIG